jgi:curved DNA-binding protein CbpA
MKTLYDVLGVSRQATVAQIEIGYKFCMESLTAEGRNSTHEDDAILAKALKEAFAVLSTPSRRQDYDQKLKDKEQIRYQEVEKASSPWIPIMIISLALIGGGIYYKVHAHNQELERIALEAAKAQADAEQAAKLAEAEQAKLDEQARVDARQAAINEQRETNQARMEGQQIHDQMMRADAQIARAKAMADQQAKLDKIREDQAAQAKARNDIAALQRALNIPIPRH